MSYAGPNHISVMSMGFLFLFYGAMPLILGDMTLSPLIFPGPISSLIEPAKPSPDRHTSKKSLPQPDDPDLGRQLTLKNMNRCDIKGYPIPDPGPDILGITQEVANVLLAIDIGNTTIGVAIFDGDQIVFKNKLATPDEVSEKFLHSLVKRNLMEQIADVVVSSVVPLVNRSLSESIKAMFGLKPLFIDHTIRTGLTIKTDNPAELGADLIAGAAGGLKFFPPPLIIIDSGTATTFALVNREHEYVGGAIMPGIEISIKNLAANAAQLDRIHFEVPVSIIGKNTADCIRAGLYYCNLGGLDFMAGEYKKLLGEDARIIVTGGLIRYFKDQIREIDLYEPDLIYYGLKRIFDLQ